MVTYDNKAFSFQGECTYLLSMDAERGDWIVYGRFVTCGTVSDSDYFRFNNESHEHHSTEQYQAAVNVTLCPRAHVWSL